jgi:Tfp pilus assembly major pilin PilA
MREGLMSSRISVPSTENYESKQGVVSGLRDMSGNAGGTDV